MLFLLLTLTITTCILLTCKKTLNSENFYKELTRARVNQAMHQLIQMENLFLLPHTVRLLILEKIQATDCMVTIITPKFRMTNKFQGNLSMTLPLPAP